MARATPLAALRESNGGETTARPTRLRHSIRARQAFVVVATVVAALGVATPATAWPMCGG